MSHKQITATSILLTSKENCKQMTSQAMVTTSFCPTSIWPQGKGTSACTTSKCKTSKYPVTLPVSYPCCAASIALNGLILLLKFSMVE